MSGRGKNGRHSSVCISYTSCEQRSSVTEPVPHDGGQDKCPCRMQRGISCVSLPQLLLDHRFLCSGD
ncbi:hypothetical protein B0H17DRAFT_1057546 [Mycena rosella]|uniref:Uncharacterized protein n=1 Tax=Mycena rosella TaxID=1033263 RepID=A0AAD7DMZ3_MYCRO|nr:hypothetical protein B0H17DRAFT_1057546 [Mycena rosella]